MVKKEIKALFLVHLSAKAALVETERVHLCHLSCETEEISFGGVTLQSSQQGE